MKRLERLERLEKGGTSGGRKEERTGSGMPSFRALTRWGRGGRGQRLRDVLGGEFGVLVSCRWRIIRSVNVHGHGVGDIPQLVAYYWL